MPATTSAKSADAKPLRVDHALLESVGLGGLSERDRNDLLAAIYGEIESRVGGALATRMSESQLDEFEALASGDDEAGAAAWLEQNAPDYQDVVRARFEAVVAELRASHDEIVRRCTHTGGQNNAS